MPRGRRAYEHAGMQERTPAGGGRRTLRDYLGRGPWFTVGVLTAANSFAFLDRQVLGLLIEPVRADLGLTDTQISILIGFAFAIFYSVFGIPIGRLVDARSRRLIIAIALITDNVFADPADLRYSLAMAPLVTVSLGLVFLLAARRRYRALPRFY